MTKYNVGNNSTDLLSLETFGPVDYISKLDDFETAYELVEREAGSIVSDNLQDRSFAAALRIAGWNPTSDPQAEAIEWYETDYEYAETPDVSSEEFTIANFNSTFYAFSEANQFAIDPRGLYTFLKGQASEFLTKNDTRLLLNTIVKDISYNDDGVPITNADGSCITADYAITTFFIGVL